jgi:hypothetical protein
MTIDIYDIINVFAFTSEYILKNELNESHKETLQKFFNSCIEDQQNELLEHFPEVVHVILTK